jgi:hypothetical protein
MSATQSSASHGNTPGGARSRPDLNPRWVIIVSGSGIPVNDCIGIDESSLVIRNDGACVPIGRIKPITISDESASLSGEYPCAERENKEGLFHCCLRMKIHNIANPDLRQDPKQKRGNFPTNSAAVKA